MCWLAAAVAVKPLAILATGSRYGNGWGLIHWPGKPPSIGCCGCCNCWGCCGPIVEAAIMAAGMNCRKWDMLAAWYPACEAPPKAGCCIGWVPLPTVCAGGAGRDAGSCTGCRTTSVFLTSATSICGSSSATAAVVPLLGGAVSTEEHCQRSLLSRCFRSRLRLRLRLRLRSARGEGGLVAAGISATARASRTGLGRCGSAGSGTCEGHAGGGGGTCGGGRGNGTAGETGTGSGKGSGGGETGTGGGVTGTGGGENGTALSSGVDGVALASTGGACGGGGAESAASAARTSLG
mmetsp:Transcript_37882/g.82614  ORF Transcript_37882/g.82614 Transcript_37882/m.82614 type:complete len:293 (-) Transcript_37882:803-1681(-)